MRNINPQNDNLSVKRQNGESQNGSSKKAKHVKFSEKQTFLTPWYARTYENVSRAYHGEMFVFRKIWRGLLSCYLRFEIRPFALLPTNSQMFSWEFCKVLKKNLF